MGPRTERLTDTHLHCRLYPLRAGTRADLCQKRERYGSYGFPQQLLQIGGPQNPQAFPPVAEAGSMDIRLHVFKQ